MKKIKIVINLKTYKYGKEALKLAKIIENFDKNIIIGVQATDIFEISRIIKNPVYAQHVDFFEPGRNTGYLTPESIKAAGACGTFLNHSEHKLDFKTLKVTIERCKNINLKTLVFVSNLNEALKLKFLKPDYIVFEPPELVAGNISVSKAKPDLIKKFSKKLKYPFLVGAGIKDNQDIKIALSLGAKGVAISSAITLAKNPYNELKKLFNN